MPAVSILITMLRSYNLESGPHPFVEIFKFFLAYLLRYMYKSNTMNLDDMGCTCNAGYVIGMISKTSHGKR